MAATGKFLEPRVRSAVQVIEDWSARAQEYEGENGAQRREFADLAFVILRDATKGVSANGMVELRKSALQLDEAVRGGQSVYW